MSNVIEAAIVYYNIPENQSHAIYKASLYNLGNDIVFLFIFIKSVEVETGIGAFERSENESLSKKV